MKTFKEIDIRVLFDNIYIKCSGRVDFECNFFFFLNIISLITVVCLIFYVFLVPSQLMLVWCIKGRKAISIIILYPVYDIVITYCVIIRSQCTYKYSLIQMISLRYYIITIRSTLYAARCRLFPVRVGKQSQFTIFFFPVSSYLALYSRCIFHVRCPIQSHP